jgi:hypothetical protein
VERATIDSCGLRLQPTLVSYMEVTTYGDQNAMVVPASGGACLTRWQQHGVWVVVVPSRANQWRIGSYSSGSSLQACTIC